MFPSHVTPRRLLIRGAQPLFPCTTLSCSRRYKSPCRAIFCLLITTCRAEDASYSSWTLVSCLWDQQPRAALSYLPATVEISSESPRATTNSYGGSTIISTYQADYNNSSSQSSNTHHPRVCGHIYLEHSYPPRCVPRTIHKPANLDVRTHLLDAIQRATTSRAHFNQPRADDVTRENISPTYPMCMWLSKSHARTCPPI